MPTAPEIVRLKITLDDVKPTVMRRLEVPVSTTLDTLHEMIQSIMPWDNYHMYQFYLRLIDDTRWGLPPPENHDFGMDIRDSRAAKLASVLAAPNFKVLRYNYDFGDDWRHTIKVERRFPAELWEQYPRLVDAKGRCPPEDIGGSWGYADYLEAISDKTHKRHAEFMGWLGRRDPNEINRPALELALARFSASPHAPAKPPPKLGRRKSKTA